MKSTSNPAVTVDSAADVPTLPGTPFGGGFYAGPIALDGKVYALIVAPKALGEHAGVIWKKNWQQPTPAAQSVIDGFANTEAMNDADHPAAQWARGLRIAGLDDWYLPARDELELLYRNLKPGTADNWTYGSRLGYFGAAPGQYNGVDEHGNGHNASSLPPGDAYTDASPAQTVAEAFRDPKIEGFHRSWYWSSTEFGSAGAWVQHFVDGSQAGGGKGLVLRARAVRKVLI